MSHRHRAWLPRQGKASSKEEVIVQTAIKVFAWLPVYTAVVVTATLLFILFGVPFVEDARW
jgi:hypothetical protein